MGVSDSFTSDEKTYLLIYIYNRKEVLPSYGGKLLIINRKIRIRRFRFRFVGFYS